MAQCNQHVFSTVAATEFTQYQYQDCDGLIHWFGLPTGGYTIILCADIGTTFVLSGDGFVYPLLVEHPSYVSCLPLEPSSCLGDFDNDGVVDVDDMLTFLTHFGPCD
ncbi:MAG TPA: hypothetical protein EYO58_06160 [Flavobacteriales bacterium]|nr:hypothetical protein [Flavobacteriales bacterium]HIB77195.1 hypothetical protein [Flavobacteriales bacterium]